MAGRRRRLIGRDSELYDSDDRDGDRDRYEPQLIVKDPNPNKHKIGANQDHCHNTKSDASPIFGLLLVVVNHHFTRPSVVSATLWAVNGTDGKLNGAFWIGTFDKHQSLQNTW